MTPTVEILARELHESHRKAHYEHHGHEARTWEELITCEQRELLLQAQYLLSRFVIEYMPEQPAESCEHPDAPKPGGICLMINGRAIALSAELIEAMAKGTSKSPREVYLEGFSNGLKEAMKIHSHWGDTECGVGSGECEVKTA